MSRYTDRITNYHAGKPKFFAHVDLSTRPLSDVSDAMSRLIPDFDIDTAVGVQLDVVGEWVGRSRRVATPVTGIYFRGTPSGLAGTRGSGKAHMTQTTVLSI